MGVKQQTQAKFDSPSQRGEKKPYIPNNFYFERKHVKHAETRQD
jgi:hypothetical protein